jgi:hypothetical protein
VEKTVQKPALWSRKAYQMACLDKLATKRESLAFSKPVLASILLHLIWRNAEHNLIVATLRYRLTAA